MKNRFEEYNKEVMKRFLHPKYSGKMKNPDAVGETMNDSCGDMMKISLKIKDNKIKDIKFQTMGCAAAIASSDALCELAKGKKLEDINKIDNKLIIKKLKGLPSIKLHCSVLGEKTLKKAIDNFKITKLKKRT
tara:strand:- start:249 stop:647 length:399 start_codon:yes stop_codon:yes gene_type:complete